MTLLVLNGPNLNLLGTREPETYGKTSLSDLEEQLKKTFTGVDLHFAQSNHEGVLIDALHAASRDGVDAIVFNPGAFTHTSVALRDAVAGITPPVVEVHISNIHARESFRHASLIAPACIGQISGLGLSSYFLAVAYFLRRY